MLQPWTTLDIQSLKWWNNMFYNDGFSFDRDTVIWYVTIHAQMTSFIDYVNNIVIKLSIYFNSHMPFVEQLLTSFSSEFMYSYRTVVHTNIKMLVLFVSRHIIFFRQKNIKNNHLSTDFCNLSSADDVVYKERWRHWPKLVADLFNDFVSISLA